MLYTQSNMIYEIQWTNETFLYKNISLILFLKGAHSLLLVWEIDGETYTQTGDFFLSHTFFREPGVPTLAPEQETFVQIDFFKSKEISSGTVLVIQTEFVYQEMIKTSNRKKQKNNNKYFRILKSD